MSRKSKEEPFMSEFAKDAVGFLIGCIGVAAIVFAFWGGIAVLGANGQSQTCSRHGGQWVATDTVASVTGDYGVDRVRECRR